jgi:hypothetical protein
MMNKAASELGKLGKGIKKTMTPEAMKQRREAAKRPRKRGPKKRSK